MSKLYVIRDIEHDEIVGVTQSKELLNLFLRKRDPKGYDWVKIKDENHIQMTLNRYCDCVLVGFGDFALSQLEFTAVQDQMLEIPPFIMHTIERVMPRLKYLKLTDEEKSAIKEALAIIHSHFRTIEEPPAYLDTVVDETELLDEYLLAKKYFMEECL